jgi:hypothetical protein
VPGVDRVGDECGKSPVHSRLSFTPIHINLFILSVTRVSILLSELGIHKGIKLILSSAY